MTTTFVGRLLRSVALRTPIERIETSQPFSVVWVTVFQRFVTEAPSVTFRTARCVDAASRAGARERREQA